MRKIFLNLFLILNVLGCKELDKTELNIGMWHARMAVMDGHVLPFNFELNRVGGSYEIEVYNANEVVKIDDITTTQDSILIKMPVFEGYISGKFTSESIEGSFIKESLDRVVPFSASFNEAPRFETALDAKVNVSGIWETVFSENTEDSYVAKGIFAQNGNEVTGTFRTTTGDYRYLEGVVEGDSLKLSTFDGAHAFLFAAKVTDSSLNGVFYSGNHFKEPFIGKRNEVYELPDEDTLTFLKDGYERLEFSFPDSEKKMVSLNAPEFKDKVVIVQVMGTWCPNCLDETRFLAAYLDQNKHPDLKVIALAFEYAKTEETALAGIERLRQRTGVEYPILLAQYGSSSKAKANEKLPMLNHVLSYPTTIFMDKKGDVRKIHTGFNGPATGQKYVEFKLKFDEFVRELLAE